jgi:hypothetical protein
MHMKRFAVLHCAVKLFSLNTEESVDAFMTMTVFNDGAEQIGLDRL